MNRGQDDPKARQLKRPTFRDEPMSARLIGRESGRQPPAAAKRGLANVNAAPVSDLVAHCFALAEAASNAPALIYVKCIPVMRAGQSADSLFLATCCCCCCRPAASSQPQAPRRLMLQAARRALASH